jgi:pyruvate formate lyase activating enzyme
MNQPIVGKPGRYWHVLQDGRVQCDVCPRYCKLHEGQRGLCFVRAQQGGQIVLTPYGRSSGFCIDPIEKKPLNHLRPSHGDARDYDEFASTLKLRHYHFNFEACCLAG